MRALSKRRQGIPRGQALQWVLRNPDGGVFAVQRADLLASFWTRKRPMLANESLISMERAKRVLGSRPEHDRDKPRQVERGASYLSGTFPVLALFLFATLNRPLQRVTSACPGLWLMLNGHIRNPNRRGHMIRKGESDLTQTQRLPHHSIGSDAPRPSAEPR